MNEEKDERPDFLEWKRVREKRDLGIYLDYIKSGMNANKFCQNYFRTHKNCSVNAIKRILELQKIKTNIY